MSVTFKGAPPLFVIVAVWAALIVLTRWLPKVRELVDNVTVGCVTPVPDRFTICGDVVASSVNVSVAENGFVVGGVKVTLTTHEALATTVEPLVHVVPEAMAKSVGFVPPRATVVRCRVSVPVLVNVTACAALVVKVI
jgi:hypothetical protein